MNTKPRSTQPRQRPARGPAGSTVIAMLLSGMAWATIAVAHDQVPGAKQTRPVLLRGGDLYTVSQGVMPQTDLLFDNGKITAIGKGLAAPAGAQVVDVAGQRVYPGLVAAATTVGLIEIGAVRATDDLAEVGALTPEVEAHVAYNPDSEVIPTLRSNGLTTVQVIPRGELLTGQTYVAHLDGWTKEDAALRLSAGLHLGWPSAGVINAWWMPLSPEDQKRQQTERRQKLAQAFDDALSYHRARAADSSTPVDLRWEAMRPLFAGKLPLLVSADDYRQIVEALSFTKARGLKMVLVGGAEADLAADLLKAQNVPVILRAPTALPPRPDQGFDQTFGLAARLHAKGVKFALALPDEAPAGQRNLAFEAGFASAYGLPKDQALRAVTLSPAEILGVADREGSLEVGKNATLFVSQGDVLDFLGQKVTSMWIEGRAVDLDNRHRMLERKYRQKVERARAGD